MNSHSVEIDDLKARIQELEETVVSARRDTDAFVYSVSHDLKGPLRTVMAASMILIEDFSGDLSTEARDQLKIQANAAKKMSVLVEELLTLSRLARDGVKKEPVDLSQTANNVAGHRPNTAITIESGLTADCDPRFVGKLLDHLVDNSIKFAQPDRTLQIEIGQRDRAFFVRDNGTGFTESQAQRIFLPFERLLGDELPGRGMGLAYAKKIVEQHGGKIWAEGVPGEGATVFFTL